MIEGDGLKPFDAEMSLQWTANRKPFSSKVIGFGDTVAHQSPQWT